MVSAHRKNPSRKNRALITLLRGFPILASWLLVSCATVEVPKDKVLPEVDPDEAWRSVLSEFVDDRGRVNFTELSRRPQKLMVYVRYISNHGPRSQPSRFATPQLRLSYYLNSYNALSMYNILDSGLPESLSGLKKVRFFYLKKFYIDGEKMSLYAYENDIIRKVAEERVHFALNCMSRGCPRLPKIPFSEKDLDEVLTNQATEFFNESRNVVVDSDAREVHLSQILEFFTKDFLRASPSLIAYANRFRKDKLPEDFRVKFIAYDWQVNHQEVP